MKDSTKPMVVWDHYAERKAAMQKNAVLTNT